MGEKYIHPFFIHEAIGYHHRQGVKCPSKIMVQDSVEQVPETANQVSLEMERVNSDQNKGDRQNGERLNSLAEKEKGENRDEDGRRPRDRVDIGNILRAVSSGQTQNIQSMQDPGNNRPEQNIGVGVAEIEYRVEHQSESDNP
jgi:hypothetical protein